VDPDAPTTMPLNTVSGGETATQRAAAPAAAAVAAPSNVQVIGASLYSQYPLSLELAGIILTVALVGAVVIARKNTGSMHDALGTGKLPAE